MSIGERLLEWYRSNARSLPWREEPRDPYRVLVSEFMLQQTQVDRVVPKFEAFLASFPTLERLAVAHEDEVLEAWSGLGYYRRARMLHRLARQVHRGQGQLPGTAAELRELPGVGPYTAAAIASMAFGEPVPVVDGNVMRVGSRVLLLSEDPRKAGARRAIAEWMQPLLAHGEPGMINEALMELGASVCLPASPACPLCPLAEDCRALAHGNPEYFPIPRKRRQPVHLRWAAACCIDGDGRWLLQRVSGGPILSGLWLPPIAELTDHQSVTERAVEVATVEVLGPATRLPVVHHSITHRRIRVHPVRLWVSALADIGPSRRWVDPANPGVPTSSLLNKLIQINNLEFQDRTE